MSGAVFGPLVFGPMFADRALTPDELACRGSRRRSSRSRGCVSFGVRPDPKELSRRFATRAATRAAAPLREILAARASRRRWSGAVASFAVMVGVMNLAGYVAVGHHHTHGDIFTIISFHIVGMYGLVLVVGDIVERIGRGAGDGDRPRA